MPTPNPGESREDFIGRCIPIAIRDGTAEDESQAFAVCNSLYDQPKQTVVASPTSERGWTAQQTIERVNQQGRQFTKVEANYIQPASLEDAPMQCRLCYFYRGPDGNGIQKCQVVTGGIQWFGHSDLFIDAEQQQVTEQENARNVEDEMNKRNDVPSEYKTLPLIVTKIDADRGIVTHTVAVMGNVDLGNDVIHLGAFTKTINERLHKIRVLDSHNTDSVMRAVGKPIAMREVSGAELPLQVKTQFPDATGALIAETQFLITTPEGKGVFDRIKAGVVDEYSIGYDTMDFDFEERKINGNKETVRNLRTIKLYEYSPVIFAMNPATSTVGVKGASGAMDLPIASREHAWDSTAASAGIRRLTDSEEEPSARYQRGFFWFDSDDADQFGAYKLPFAAAVDGDLTAIPRGIFATAGVLSGARGGVDIPSSDLPAVRQRVSRYYARMREQFDDDGIIAPWEKASPAYYGTKRHLSELVRNTTIAFYSQYPDSFDEVFWVKQIWEEFIIVDQQGRINATWKIPYTTDGGVINFVSRNDWLQVEAIFVPVTKDKKQSTEAVEPHQETPQDEAGPDEAPPTSKWAEMLAEIGQHLSEIEQMEV